MRGGISCRARSWTVTLVIPCRHGNLWAMTASFDPDALAAWDAADPLAVYRERFRLPSGIVYLDGNSLGCLPVAVAERIATVASVEWGLGLIGSWFDAGWMDLPVRVGAKIARLVGAEPREVIAADSTSINLFKTLVSAIRLRPGRRVIVTEADNFPTDLYIIDSVAAQMGLAVRRVRRQALIDAIDDQVAAVTLTHVNYRTAAIHDMHRITEVAHARGALTIWDLAHTAGAMPCDLNGADADFAIGCGYKYLNGGPGAPAFVFVASRHQAAATQPLTGWLSHSAPFAFDDAFAPALGMSRFLCGTPSVLALAALDAALDVFETVSLADVRQKSRRMTDVFVALFDARLAPLGFTLCCERDADWRGSHVSFSHPDGEAIMRAVAAKGVIGDFRPPDTLRFGFAPLYNRYADVHALVAAVLAVVGQQ